MACPWCGSSLVELKGKDLSVAQYNHIYRCSNPHCGYLEHSPVNRLKNPKGGKMDIKYVEKRYGWECPKCGAVMSPDEVVCINCKGKAFQSTSTIISSPEIYLGTVEGWKDKTELTLHYDKAFFSP